MMDIMEFSKQIVDTFYRRREKMEDYFVRLDVAPNPLNFDGCDEVKARVVRRDRVWGQPGFKPVDTETVVLENADFCFTVEAALTELLKAARAHP